MTTLTAGPPCRSLRRRAPRGEADGSHDSGEKRVLGGALPPVPPAAKPEDLGCKAEAATDYKDLVHHQADHMNATKTM